MSSSDQPSLVVVGIETLSDARYKFPDMPWEFAKHLFEHADEMQAKLDTLILYNVSEACLVLPWRIIRRVWINGAIVWPKPETESPDSPASTATTS